MDSEPEFCPKCGGKLSSNQFSGGWSRAVTCGQHYWKIVYGDMMAGSSYCNMYSIKNPNEVKESK